MLKCEHQSQAHYSSRLQPRPDTIRKIVLVAHNLRSAGGLSVGQNIVATLPQIAPMHQYLMIVPEGCGYQPFTGRTKVEVYECRKMSLLSLFFWERVALRKMVLGFKPDWLWALGNRSLINPHCSQSLLLHNPHRVYPTDAARPWRESIFKWLSDAELRRGLSSVSRLYCQTETMRHRSSEVLKYPYDRIGICPNAFSPLIQISRDWPAELARFRGNFILFALTRYYPHKNLEIIVETFSRYRDQLKNIVCVLTISKDQGSGALRLINRIHAESLDDQIVCIGAIPQSRLGEFYHAADVMILPTLLESFSGTYLEAMQMDTPILTSDRDFAHEVCGKAAVYVDPFSPEDLKKGILELKVNHSLRAGLIVNGRTRLEQQARTWPAILRDVLEQEGIEHE